MVGNVVPARESGAVFQQSGDVVSGQRPCKSGGVAAVCGPVAATFGTMENRRNGAQLVALHAARNAGVGIAAALVRQYTFNWESTLLSNAASVRAVEMLAWLPSKLGFPVPDARAVIEGRLNGNIADARAWSGLLVGSIVCYGILPRLLAWVVCKILLKTSENGLDLEKTYYQAVIRRWQNKITDADTRRETVSAVSPKIVLNDAPKWALMLETEWQDGQWFEGRLAQEWLDKGVAANREQVAALETELKQKPAQLLIGVRAQTVPDRGVLRQIVRLSEAAQGGAVVQLLAEQGLSDDLSEKLEHWRNALTECGAAWLEPDRVAQEGRLKDQ
ncbi:putative inner membrane protein [Neisseria gonorrhoeae]|uniref:Putative inner membrane protein n=1 Tax=Neisseria gonorrhoeae TaxID=485 RepID=A0A379B1D1_NEIGO|nr:putative inner membrane protein [Neisseria gonorrhoeae]